jgi:hypothetical protein
MLKPRRNPSESLINQASEKPCPRLLSFDRSIEIRPDLSKKVDDIVRDKSNRYLNLLSLFNFLHLASDQTVSRKIRPVKVPSQFVKGELFLRFQLI